jgi:hypothetical protein
MTTAIRLDEFQRDFAAALLGEPGSPAAEALAAKPGFAVHRNTVLRGCIDALAANFPTVLSLVGADGFDAAAGAFARACPPREGSLCAYGAEFADFLEALPSAAELPYLGGVARLDRAWTEAHLAADAPVLDAAALASLDPSALLAAALVPHPAARWIVAPDLPVFTIWRRHREHAPLDDALEVGEAGLLTRPVQAVAWQAIDAAAAAFLDACAHGARFGDAATPGVDRWMPALLRAGAFCRVEHP